jgi:hypothetical protein
MADLLTPHLGFPYPNPDDPLGGVDATVGALADAVETYFRNRFPSGASTSIADTTMPAAAGVWEQVATGGASQFTAPPLVNGRVIIEFESELQIDLTAVITPANIRQLWLTVVIIEGTSSSPGAIVDPATDNDALMVGVAGASGSANAVRAGSSFLSATLTPGATYHTRYYKKVSHTTSCAIKIGNRGLQIRTK